jgi:ABC-type cobalamin transport system permease subunit
MTSPSETTSATGADSPPASSGSPLIALKILVAAVGAWMIYVVTSTSLHSNLFKEWNALGAIPWMRATLWDFYANVLVIYLWVCYKERSLAMRIIWLILLCALGSIATCAYVLIQLFKLKPGEGLKELLINRNRS